MRPDNRRAHGDGFPVVGIGKEGERQLAGEIDRGGEIDIPVFRRRFRNARQRFRVDNPPLQETAHVADLKPDIAEIPGQQPDGGMERDIREPHFPVARRQLTERQVVGQSGAEKEYTVSARCICEQEVPAVRLVRLPRVPLAPPAGRDGRGAAVKAELPVAPGTEAEQALDIFPDHGAGRLRPP